MKGKEQNEKWPNVVALIKDGEKYVFAYDDASRKALLGVFGNFAENPELSFSWHDAAVLSRKVRESKCTPPVNPRLPRLRTR